MKVYSQLWRAARLFGSAFGQSFWVGLVHMPTADKYAVLAAAVGAAEVGYRAVLPSGKLPKFLTELIQAYRVVKAIEAQAQPAKTG